MAKWLRRSVSNLVGSTRVGSNPVAGITNNKLAANSAVLPSEVGKCVLRGTLMAQAVVLQAIIGWIAARNLQPQTKVVETHEFCVERCLSCM